MKQKPVVTEFLNVDLDLRATSGLDELLQALKPRMMVVSRDGHRASLELAKAQPQSADKAILQIVKIIQALSPRTRAIWKHCQMRSMSIGIQAGNEPHATDFALSAKTVDLVASIGAEVVFTVYGCSTKTSSGSVL